MDERLEKLLESTGNREIVSKATELEEKEELVLLGVVKGMELQKNIGKKEQPDV